MHNACIKISKVKYIHKCILMFFLNMSNIFSHQKIVYWDFGTAKMLKNCTTENYLIINSMSEWHCQND